MKIYPARLMRLFLLDKNLGFLAKKIGVANSTLQAIRDNKYVPIKVADATKISQYMGPAIKLRQHFNQKAYSTQDIHVFLQDKSLHTLGPQIGIAYPTLQRFRDVANSPAMISKQMILSDYIAHSKEQLPKGEAKAYPNKIIHNFLKDKNISRIVNKTGIPRPTVKGLKDNHKTRINTKQRTIFSRYMNQSIKTSPQVTIRAYNNQTIHTFLQDKDLEHIAKNIGTTASVLAKIKKSPIPHIDTNVHLLLSRYIMPDEPKLPEKKKNPFHTKEMVNFLQGKLLQPISRELNMSYATLKRIRDVENPNVRTGTLKKLLRYIKDQGPEQLKIYPTRQMNNYIKRKDPSLVAKKSGLSPNTIKRIKDMPEAPISDATFKKLANIFKRKDLKPPKANMKLYTSQEIHDFLKDKDLNILADQMDVSLTTLRDISQDPNMYVDIIMGIKITNYMNNPPELSTIAKKPRKKYTPRRTPRKTTAKRKTKKTAKKKTTTKRIPKRLARPKRLAKRLAKKQGKKKTKK